MASKAELRRERRRQQEELYETRFLATLARAGTVAEAAAVVYHSMPSPDATGRLRHTNLQFFLGAFHSVSTSPAYALDRRHPLVPSQSTARERGAYLELTRRLAQSGEISHDDSAHVERRIQGYHTAD